MEIQVCLIPTCLFCIDASTATTRDGVVTHHQPVRGSVEGDGEISGSVQAFWSQIQFDTGHQLIFMSNRTHEEKHIKKE